MATPNMNLTEVVPGVTPGPDYATGIADNFDVIDSHNHTTGLGVKIPVAGININGDLPFSGNGAISLGKSQYNSLGATLSGSSNYRSVHVVNGELYYLDGSGNAVQITSSGSVAGAAGNITGLSSPASVTFSTNKYIFKDTANSFAKMECADLRLFEDSSSAISNYVALISPASLASTYTLTMPAALPASTEYMAVSSAGAVSTVTSNELVETVTRSTGATVGSLGVAISSADSGSFSTTSTSAVDVTNLTVTITTSGRPVMIGLMGTTSTGYISVNTSTQNFASGVIEVVRDTTTISSTFLRSVADPASTPQVRLDVPCGSIMALDAVSAGTYTYKIQAYTPFSSTTLAVVECLLFAYEL